MSKSKNSYHPHWRSKRLRKILKYKNFRMKPYGLHMFCNYGNEFYKGKEEREYTLTTKNKERRNNKINPNLIDEDDISRNPENNRVE